MSEHKYKEAYKNGIEKGRELSRLEHIFSNCDEAYQQGRADAIGAVKQFLYKNKNIGYTELIGFLDNLEEESK